MPKLFHLFLMKKLSFVIIKNYRQAYDQCIEITVVLRISSIFFPKLQLIGSQFCTFPPGYLNTNDKLPPPLPPVPRRNLNLPPTWREIMPVSCQFHLWKNSIEKMFSILIEDLFRIKETTSQFISCLKKSFPLLGR